MQRYEFQAPFIPREKVQEEADRFRTRYWPSDELPIDIHSIIEFELDMKIRPIRDLQKGCDVDALLLGDLTTIVVDWAIYMDDRMQNRLRYSLAHEVGHRILHPGIYGKIGHSTVKEWIECFRQIPEEQYSWIEQHAYEFAGRLLVPRNRLKTAMQSAIETANKAGFVAWDESGEAAREYIANSLCRLFGVSRQVIEKRILREKLWPPA